jgi:magnesium-transporting ATPase (P-type)
MGTAFSLALQEKLTKLAKRIGFVGMLLGLFNLIILIILYFAVPSRQDPNESRAVTILSFFLLSITIVVVAVPEGLHMAVILSLAFSMKRMIKDKALVRKLTACETMGSATCICSDKTGTLTQNRMTVTAGRFFGATSMTSVPSQADLVPEPAAATAAAGMLALAVSLNSDANVRVTGQNSQGPIVDFSGNKTEGALLLVLSTAFGLDHAAVRRSAATAAARTHNTFDLFRENFNSRRKRMTTVIVADVFESAAASILGAAAARALCGPGGLASVDAGGAIVLTKGASEILLDLCAAEATSATAASPFTPESRLALRQTITDLASGGLRTYGARAGFTVTWCA